MERLWCRLVAVALFHSACCVTSSNSQQKTVAPTAKQCRRWAKKRRCIQDVSFMATHCTPACVKHWAKLDELFATPVGRAASDDECFEKGIKCKQKPDGSCNNVMVKCDWIDPWISVLEKINQYYTYSALQTGKWRYQPLFFEEEEQKHLLTYIALKSGEADSSIRQFYMDMYGYPSDDDGTAHSQLRSIHGIDIVHRFLIPASGALTLEQPLTPLAILQQPLSASSDCPEPRRRIELRRAHSTFALARIRNASVTFAGVVITASGAVLMRQLMPLFLTFQYWEDLQRGLGSAYVRLSRRCPRSVGLGRYCFRTASPPQHLTMSSFDADTNNQFCPQGKTFVRFQKLLAWIAPKSENYWHFLTDSLPGLAALLDDGPPILQDPELRVHASEWSRFAAEYLQLLGLEAVWHDPCKVYSASEVYATVQIPHVHTQTTPGGPYGSGEINASPTRHMLSIMRSMLGKSVPQGLSTESGRSANSRCRAILLDRPDAPRAILNRHELEDVMEPALGKHQISLEVVSDSRTVASQIATFRQSCLLLGVHGAGMTNMIFMPEGASVVELVPAIPGESKYRQAPLGVLGNNLNLCGLTSLWHLAQTLGHKFYAVLLHGYGMNDKLRVDVAPFAQLLANVTESIGLEKTFPRTEL